MKLKFQEKFLYPLGNIPRFIMSSEETEKNETAREVPGDLEVQDSKENFEKVDRVLQTEEGKETQLEEEVVEEEIIKKIIVVVDSKEKTLDSTISALRKREDYQVVGVESTKEFFEVTSIDLEKERKSDVRAITPDEYWKIAKGKVPDLIITDLDLKDLDGWEFIFRLKFDNRYYEYKNAPILVLTDSPIEIETTKKVQAESIHDYIPKSIKGKELLKKVENYFETMEKLGEKKKEFKTLVGHVVASEYVRLSLAVRIRLKYLKSLKKRLEILKEIGGKPSEIKILEDVVYLEKRNIIKYERRKNEIKKLVKSKKNTEKIKNE
jgi:CheY-like chemotaxis protein